MYMISLRLKLHVSTLTEIARMLLGFVIVPLTNITTCDYFSVAGLASFCKVRCKLVLLIIVTRRNWADIKVILYTCIGPLKTWLWCSLSGLIVSSDFADFFARLRLLVSRWDAVSSKSTKMSNTPRLLKEKYDIDRFLPIPWEGRGSIFLIPNV